MKLTTLIPVLFVLVVSACSDREKIVESGDKVPEVLEPSNDTDGYEPFTPENAISVLKAELRDEIQVENLLRFARSESSNVQYVGSKDEDNDAIFMTEMASFKKFLEDEIKRLESEYPQYTKFVFTAEQQNFRIDTADQKITNLNIEGHHSSGLGLNPNFRMHENLKWNFAGEDSAAREASAKMIDAYNGNGFTIQCYGEYAYSSGMHAIFDLTRCDSFGPNGQLVATTAN